MFSSSSGSAGDAVFENPGKEIAEEMRLVDKLDSLTLHDDDSSAEKLTTSPHGRPSNTDSFKTDVSMTDITSPGTVLPKGSDLTGASTSKSLTLSHGRDVVKFDVESASSSVHHKDVNPVLSKTDTSVSSSSCDGAHTVVTPDVVKAYVETEDQEKMSETENSMLGKRDELNAKLGRQQISIAEDSCHGDVAGRGQSSSRVQELTIADPVIALDDKPEGGEPIDVSCDVTCDQAAQVTLKESGRTDGVVTKLVEGTANDTKFNVQPKSVSHPNVSRTANSKGVSEHGCRSPSQALANIQRLSQMQSLEVCKKPSSGAKKSASPLDAIWRAMREWKTAATVTFLRRDDKDDRSPRKTTEDGGSAAGPAPDSAAKLFQKKVSAFYGEAIPIEPCEPINSPSKVRPYKHIIIYKHMH